MRGCLRWKILAGHVVAMCGGSISSCGRNNTAIHGERAALGVEKGKHREVHERACGLEYAVSKHARKGTCFKVRDGQSSLHNKVFG